MTPVTPWYTPGTRAISGDFYAIADRVHNADRAVLLREYPALNTAGTVAQRMKRIIPDDCPVKVTSRKVPQLPDGTPGQIGVFAYVTAEQLGRLLDRRDYVGPFDFSPRSMTGVPEVGR